MNRMFARGLAALVLLLVVWVQVVPEATAAGRPRPERPFRGSAGGIVTGFFDPDEDSPFGGFTASWTGNATHLGRFTRQEVLHFTNEDGSEFRGEMIFTAANGDNLFVEFSGAFEPGPGGMLLAEGPYEIVGGTGRFAHASGSARYKAFAVFLEGGRIEVGVDFDGHIRF